ncbi:MAG: FAD:protein FMN transferase [Verrucomicrobiota bacterium]
MTSVAVARNAMATRFEIILYGDNPVSLRAAGEEALDEIERLENQLSLYRPSSEISRINAGAASGPVRIEPGLFRLLQHAQRLHRESDGTFDITIAPLIRCWGFMGGTGHLPDPADLAIARTKVGMRLVSLNEADFTVRFNQQGVMLDLGSIGKGYALERAAAVIADAGVTSAMLQGGTSTACAIGSPPDANAWKIAIERPAPQNTRIASLEHNAIVEVGRAADFLAVIPLKDQSLSVSAIWGKSFESEGRVYGHVIDPRSGQPVSGALLAAVVVASATETDAFSTALLTLGSSGLDRITGLRQDMRALVVERSENEELRIAAKGIELRQEKVV